MTRRALELEPLEARRLLTIIRVNSFEDLASPPPGTVTLRSAIARANTDRRPDVILLPTGTYHCVKTLNIVPDGRLAIIGEEGNALIQEVVNPVDASGPTVNHTVFSVQRGARVTFVNMTLMLGEAHSPSHNKGGGGLFNRGNASLLNCAVVNNAADVGGGIDNGGNLTIVESSISGNASTDAGGGGILNTGKVTIEQSRIRDNRAASFGGGLWNLTGKAILSGNTRIDGNAPTDLLNSNGGSADVGSGVAIGRRL